MTDVLTRVATFLKESRDSMADDMTSNQVLGEPVVDMSQVRIPVNKISVNGFMISAPKRKSSGDTKPHQKSHVKRNRKLIGHIVMDPNGVSWQPKLNYLKLVFVSATVLVLLFALIRAGDKE